MHSISNGMKSMCLLFLFLMSFLFAGNEIQAGEKRINWNDRYVDWQRYSTGLSLAEKYKKPVIMIFYADWCPACQNYGAVFQSKEIIKASSDFIMIRVNVDKSPNVSAAYGFDGEYVPRTFALYPDGKVMHELYPPKKYRYSIGSNPGTLLSLMQMARSRL